MYTLRVHAEERTAALIERRCEGALALSGAARFWEQADAVATVATLGTMVAVDLPATVSNVRLLWSCLVARRGDDNGRKEPPYSLTAKARGVSIEVVAEEPIAGAEELIAFLRSNGVLRESD